MNQVDMARRVVLEEVRKILPDERDYPFSVSIPCRQVGSDDLYIFITTDSVASVRFQEGVSEEKLRGYARNAVGDLLALYRCTLDEAEKNLKGTDEERKDMTT